MRRRLCLNIALVITAAGMLTAQLQSAEKERPNIVIIMTDDMGFSDPGCFGGEVSTPNIDALSAGGLRFMNFYNCARCCPTRASLMTGLYAHQVGLARNGRSLTRDGMTIAEGLKRVGYQTGMAGKWHLSKTPVLDKKVHQKWIDHQHDPGQPFGPPETYPVKRGFDRHYGIIWGVIDYFDPFSLVDGMDPVKELPAGYYITDAITEKAVAYIGDFAKDKKPFFLYVAHCAPHWPLHARPGDIAKYRGRYDEGWHALRKKRYGRQTEMGLIDPATAPLPELDGRGKDWDALTPKEKAFQAAKMETHAAMVDRVDQGIGRILKALKNAGAYENTLILFLADNGASPEVPGGPGYDRTSQTRDGQKVHYRGFDRPGPQTTYTGIGPYWANAVNTPWRYWKKESYEGGCHTPFIAHWPKGLKAKAGSTNAELGHVMDLMPTCLELAGADYPDTFNGHTLKPLEGKSLAPVLAGGSRKGHEILFFEHEGGRAVREGDWKLVALKGKPWQLFDLSKDGTETKDLAVQHPEKVKELERKWAAWSKRVMP